MAVKGLDYLKSAERWQRYGEHYIDEARKTYMEQAKATLTLATFLLGFIGIFLQIGNVGQENICQKLFLSASFVFLTISVALGIVMFIKINTFLNKAGTYYEKLSENLHLWMIKNKQASGQEYPKSIFKGIELDNEMNSKISHAQLIFLGMGYLSVAVYFYLILFNF